MEEAKISGYDQWLVSAILFLKQLSDGKHHVMDQANNFYLGPVVFQTK